MTTFVLVHGAWHGGWCYKRVARLLRARGLHANPHRPWGARPPDEPHDRPQHPRPGHCRRDPLGGTVRRGAVRPLEQAADKIRALVYIDAFVPENGKSLLDYFPGEQMRTDAAENGEGYKVTPISAARFQVNANDAAWVDAMCVKHPLATRAEACAQRSAGAKEPIHPCHRLGAIGAVPTDRRSP